MGVAHQSIVFKFFICSTYCILGVLIYGVYDQDSSFSHVIGSDDENKNYIGSKDIDERQTTFVKGRQLLHGVLIANEVVEEARRSKRPCTKEAICQS